MNLLFSAFKMPIGKSAVVAILGLLFVFAVLTLLVLLLTLFKYVFKINFGKKNDAQAVKAENVAPTVGSDVEGETAAAIAAAVAILLEGERRAKAPFVIKSIRRL